MALPLPTISFEPFASPAGDDCLCVFTVMFNAADFPEKYVVREQRIFPGGGRVVNRFVHVVDTLKAARACVPRGLVRTAPMPGDDKVIVEVWL